VTCWACPSASAPFITCSSWPLGRPCHGDVFHITRQYEGLANTLSRLAKGARSRCEKLETKIDRTGQLGPNDKLAVELARQTEAQAQGLARDIRTLTQWLSHDVLALAGPASRNRGRHGAGDHARPALLSAGLDSLESSALRAVGHEGPM
jgi:hypothetical protein